MPLRPFPGGYRVADSFSARTASLSAIIAGGVGLLGIGIYAAIQKLTAPSRPWQFGPPADGNLIVSGGFGDARDDDRFHEGIDIPLPLNTAIKAVGSGVVIKNAYDDTSGNYIVILHELGLASYYMHLNVRSPLTVGTPVKKGQQVGKSGSTGMSSAPHLHLGFRIAPETLPTYERLFGKPRIGWGRNIGGRVSVPAEPLVPVTSYRSSVVAAAANRGVLLYQA